MIMYLRGLNQSFKITKLNNREIFGLTFESDFTVSFKSDRKLSPEFFKRKNCELSFNWRMKLEFGMWKFMQAIFNADLQKRANLVGYRISNRLVPTSWLTLNSPTSSLTQFLRKKSRKCSYMRNQAEKYVISMYFLFFLKA